MKTIKNILKKILPTYLINTLQEVRNIYLDGYALKSYSQEGEDMILRRIFENKVEGFYVDVGAHHPMRFSNTYYFYKKGWRGINIDAMPGSMKVFNKYRPRDINLEFAISSKKQKLKFFIFNEPALNTFSEQLAMERNKPPYRILEIRKLETYTLREILDEYLPIGQKIDFMNIDVEGYDYDVILSNDWEKYRPTILLVEILGSDLESLYKNETVLFLKSKKYKLFAKCFNTVFFINEGE